MSHTAVRTAWSLDLPRNKQTVLLAFADHANKQWHSHPSTKTVAWKTGYSERQVRRLIDNLVEDGILEPVDPKPGRTIIYRLNLDAGKKKPALNEVDTTIPSVDETPDITMSPLTSDVTPDIQMSPTPDIAMSETPDIQMSAVISMNQLVSNESTARPGETPDPAIDRDGDELSVTKSGRAKTLDQLLFDAIAIHILNIMDGNYDGVAGDISNYRRELKKGFKNPPVTPDEIRQFTEWYRRTKRDYTGKPLSFPNPYKIGKFYREFRDTQKQSGDNLHSVPSFMLIGGNRNPGKGTA